MADFAPHNMTSDSAPSPYVVTTNGSFYGGYEEWRIFANAHCYQDTFNSPEWIAIDLGSAHTLATYTLAAVATVETSAPRDWTILGSNDGTSWTTIDTQSGITLTTSGATFTIASPASYRYLKINVTAVNGGSHLSFGGVTLNDAGGPTNSGVNVCKVNAYAVLMPMPGVNVCKVNAYAVLASVGSAAPIWPNFAFVNGFIGNPYYQSFDLYPAAAPTTYTVLSGSLPPGLVLLNVSQDVGAIGGTPTTLGTFSFTLRATNIYGTADKSFSITITAPIIMGGYGNVTFF